LLCRGIWRDNGWVLNIGAGEIAVILVLALLILGPKRLPEMARGIGKFLREFRRQTDEVRTTLETEFYRMDRELMREEPRKDPTFVPGSTQPQTVLAEPPPPQEAVPTPTPESGAVGIASATPADPTPAPPEGAPVAPTGAAPAPIAEPESKVPPGDARSAPSSSQTTVAPEGRWEE
jgi:sec-independent protein translocase protein TatB